MLNYLEQTSFLTLFFLVLRHLSVTQDITKLQKKRSYQTAFLIILIQLHFCYSTLVNLLELTGHAHFSEHSYSASFHITPEMAAFPFLWKLS